MKFLLFAEGATERGLRLFLKRWLDARLKKSVAINVVRLDGWGNLKRRFVHAVLNAPGNRDAIAAIGVLDLNGPHFAPHLQSVEERWQWGTSDYEKRIHHTKFRMFFAVQECEAWLLSDPAALPADIGSVVARVVEDPEAIVKPSRLLDELYRKHTNRKYIKTTHGAALFGRVDPNMAYAKCKSLKRLLDAMLALAQDASPGQ